MFDWAGEAYREVLVEEVTLTFASKGAQAPPKRKFNQINGKQQKCTEGKRRRLLICKNSNYLASKGGHSILNHLPIGQSHRNI
ncbi:hypothetical protein QGM71_11485 [Virgibacillus sp. C22-A2]|uniref:Uncharacterized protein n=1 Tax=Virgibacillus tibetensis TaxID=3042313 RepID=A0ABU6KI76_9BACI|nr:hypothetical protein [Virgibacillus sp. C22-A2]